MLVEPSFTADLEGLTILVIDDDPNALGLVMEYFAEYEIVVLVAEDGATGLQRAQYAQPDLILLDILMPGFDGLETCRCLKADKSTRDIPVLFMTSLTEVDNQVKAFAAGAVDYVTKPLRRQEVVVRVVTQLRNQVLTADLRQKNHQLALEVREREEMQRERDAMHKQLYDTARLAGMAEVNAIMMHNVGNAINSINISVEVMQERMARLSEQPFVRSLQLLKQHQDRLIEFLTDNQQGRWLVKHIANGRFTRWIEAQYISLLGEIQTLRSSLQHIKEILHRQRQYVGVARLTEQVSPAALVEDALLILDSVFQRRNITVYRQFAATQTIPVERHKVVQILVNLLTNAEQAISERLRDGGVVTISIRQKPSEYVQFQVQDNGIGIAPNHREKLFQYGFTTRKNGLGLGLHGSFLTAKELGGDLIAKSDGRDKGATFVLTLPMAAARDSEPA